MTEFIKIENYINGPIRDKLKFKETYQGSLEYSENGIKIISLRPQGYPKFIEILNGNPGLVDQLKSSILNPFLQTGIGNVDILLLGDRIIIILYPLGMNYTYHKNIYLLNHYAENHEYDEFQNLLQKSDLDDVDKAHFVRPDKIEISKIVINSGINNDIIFQENMDKYQLLWNGFDISEDFLKLILSNSVDQGDDILHIYTHSTGFKGNFIEKYLPEKPSRNLLYYIRTTIDHQHSDRFVVLWNRYSGYLSDGDILQLYKKSLFDIDKEAFLGPDMKIVAFLANSPEVRNVYKI